jgi:hypothetical protein
LRLNEKKEKGCPCPSKEKRKSKKMNSRREKVIRRQPLM